MKDFDAFVSDAGFDPETLTTSQKTTLQAAWRASGNPTPEPKKEPAAQDVKIDTSSYDEKMEAIAAEEARIEGIRNATFKMCEMNRGNKVKVERLKAMCDAAVADSKTTLQRFELDLLRADRMAGPIIMQSSTPAANSSVIEAAVCRRAGLTDIEKHFNAQTLETSEHLFKRGLSLVGLLDESAKRNGWRGRADVESKDFLRAAFGYSGDGSALDLRAGTTGPSTYSLPTVVGNIANKFLKSGWLSVDNAWSMLTYRRSVNDFKTITTARLNGALIYRTLAPGGEIQHGTLSESTFTNRASTYAILIGIAREDLINDDLGAFTELSKHIGRGAGLKINDLFWTVFLNNSSFFTAGNNNVSTGGGSALGSADGAAINAAEVKFINQTDPNGYPVALRPTILLAPPTLANTARRWMGSFGFTPSGTSGLGDSNIFNGRYEVVTSPYMENSTYTGNSTAAWYLLADPNDEAVIEGVALNGRWEPTVDTAEPDFNQLGIAMRGYIDVGFAFKEPRGGVRSAGS